MKRWIEFSPYRATIVGPVVFQGLVWVKPKLGDGGFNCIFQGRYGNLAHVVVIKGDWTPFLLTLPDVC